MVKAFDGSQIAKMRTGSVGTVLLDSTLREGELYRVLPLRKKLRVAEILAELGLKRVEVTVDYPPKTSESEIRPVVQYLNERGVEVVMHGRAHRSDIEAFAKYELHGVAVYLAVSRIHREHKLRGMTEEEMRARLLEAVELCRAQGYRYVRVTLEDVSRLFVDGSREELDELLRFTEELRRAGATMVSLPDTSGLLTPSQASTFIRYCRERSALPIACHYHNDYGFASANTVVSVLEGVEEAHVTLMGIGDRNGIADLYEVVAPLADVHGIDLGIRRERLAWAYAEFSKLTGIRLPWRHPLSGDSRTVRAGVHQAMVLKRPEGYVPAGKLRHDFSDLTLAPSPLMSHKVFIELARRAGREISEEEARRAAEHVSQLYLLHGGRVRSSELREVLRSVLGFDVPDEVVRSYFGFERAYVLLKLKPQADVASVLEDVVSWPEVEAVDEVYGDADLIIVGKVAMGPDNLVERLRKRYQGVVEEMKVLITD